MADNAITSGSTSLGSSGLNSLLTFFMDQFDTAKRNRNSPLMYMNTDARRWRPGLQTLVSLQSPLP